MGSPDGYGRESSIRSDWRALLADLHSGLGRSAGMTRLKRLHSLKPGDEFLTAITSRLGYVIDQRVSHEGIPVALSTPDGGREDKVLHGDVLVRVG